MAPASGTAGVTGRRPFTYAVAILGLSVGIAACGSSSPHSAARAGAVTNASAQSALYGAARAMQSELSYAFSGTVSLPPDSVQLSGRFQAPNRLDETIQVQGQKTVRAVLVGSEVLVQDPTSGTWRPNRDTSSAPDPRATFAVLLRVVGVSRIGDAFRFSVPAALVGQLVPGLTPSGPADGSARVAGGALSHLAIDIPGRNRPVRISLDYSSLGQAPPVTLPPAAG